MGTKGITLSQKTALYDLHVEAGGKIVDFAGWSMPIHFGSQIDEHNSVRENVGVFDVSHMVILDLKGADAKAYLSKLLANDVSVLTASGKALYSCMCKEDAGVIDDLIVYYLDDTNYRLVTNAGTREKDLAWLNQQAADFDISLTEREDLSMMAVQGPKAPEFVAQVLNGADAQKLSDLKIFFGAYFGDWFIGHTGYTGEDGYEIMLPHEQAQQLYKQLLDNGVKPIGLGARDTLRLEAGMNLYGNDMDESVTPLESGLSWTVKLDGERDFNGKSTMQEQKAQGVSQKLVGLLLEGKGILRHGQKITFDGQEGEVTSGTFSPTMKRSIGMARVPAGASDQVDVDIRGKAVPARIVKMPFVRNGKVCVD